jgi:hypothetical protein
MMVFPYESLYIGLLQVFHAPRCFVSPAAPTRVGRRGGRRNEAAGEDAAQTHKVCFAADLSAESGRPVAISELDNM